MDLPKNSAKVSQTSAKHGFTLIELLFVMFLIAVLVALGFTSYTTAQKKGRDSRRKSDLKAVQRALESYRQVYGRYPGLTVGVGQLLCAGTGATQITGSDTNNRPWGTAFQCPPPLSTSPAPGPLFMTILPKDPSITNGYAYYTADGGVTYSLSSPLENNKDPDYCTGACNSCFLAGYLSVTRNYCVPNP